MYNKIIKDYILLIDELQKENNINIYVVGGFLRDFLMGKISLDVDLIIEKNAKLVAEQFRKKTNGAFVILDEDEKIFRVVVKKSNHDSINFDFGEMKGDTLKDDIFQRDFSVNALYWKVSSDLDYDNITDLVDGKKDLLNKKIRMISKKCFAEDPLRLLRAYRISAQYDFSVDDDTKKAIKVNASLISNSSPERIHDELIKLLSVDNSFNQILALDEALLLEEIFPHVKKMKDSNDYYFHPEGLWGHSKEVLFCFEFILSKLDRLFDLEEYQYLTTYLSSNNTLACLKIVSLFHDIGKPETFSMQNGRVRFFGHDYLSGKYLSNIMKELRFSNKDIQLAKKTASYHMALGNLAKSNNITDRACYRYFKRTEESALGVLFITLSDWLASIRGAGEGSYENGISEEEFLLKDFIKCHNASKRVVSWFIDANKTTKFKKLISGNDIMKVFDLKPGRMVGDILDAVSEKQAEGKIVNKNEALAYAKKWYKKNKNIEKVVITEDKDNQPIARTAKVAKSLCSRIKGLLGKDSLDIDEGLIIFGAKQIHTFFMSFSIDIIFLDKDKKVIKLYKDLRPFRITSYIWKARYVVELTSGAIDQYKIKTGNKLSWKSNL